MLTGSRNSDRRTQTGSDRSVGTRRRLRARGVRPLRPVVIIALAFTLVAIGWLALSRNGNGAGIAGSRMDSPESAANRAGPPTSRMEPDPRETMFESGVPEAVSTVPAPALSGIDAYVAESRSFVAEVHNAANSFITGADLPQPLLDDQVRRLADQLAGLEAQAAGVNGAAVIVAAHREYAPVIEALRSHTTTPATVAGALQVAQEEWQQAAATASPKLDRSLPAIASVPGPRPADAPHSPAAETE